MRFRSTLERANALAMGNKLTDTEDIECINTIKESGEYLVEIVNDILDLSKIEAGKLVLNVEAVSPHAVLGEVQGPMDVRAREKHLPLILRYDGALPESIHTDRTRLRQILINLVSNAIKFTERGRVEIVARFFGSLMQRLKELGGVKRARYIGLSGIVPMMLQALWSSITFWKYLIAWCFPSGQMTAISGCHCCVSAICQAEAVIMCPL